VPTRSVVEPRRSVPDRAMGEPRLAGRRPSSRREQIFIENGRHPHWVFDPAGRRDDTLSMLKDRSRRPAGSKKVNLVGSYSINISSLTGCCCQPAKPNQFWGRM